MDRSLVEQARRGDHEAFTSLAFELSDRLFAVAHRILRDLDSAVDALQGTLLRLWRDLPSLRDPDLIEAWAYRVLVRACRLGLWFWFRVVPVPDGLDEAFSPGRMALIGVHIALIVAGLSLATLAFIRH